MTDNITYMYGEEIANDEAWDSTAAVVDDTVNIPRGRYEELIETEAWADALDAAGVDNWDGIDFAHEIFEAFNLDAASA